MEAAAGQKRCLCVPPRVTNCVAFNSFKNFCLCPAQVYACSFVDPAPEGYREAPLVLVLSLADLPVYSAVRANTNYGSGERYV